MFNIIWCTSLCTCLIQLYNLMHLPVYMFNIIWCPSLYCLHPMHVIYHMQLHRIFLQLYITTKWEMRVKTVHTVDSIIISLCIFEQEVRANKIFIDWSGLVTSMFIESIRVDMHKWRVEGWGKSGMLRTNELGNWLEDPGGWAKGVSGNFRGVSVDYELILGCCKVEDRDQCFQDFTSISRFFRPHFKILHVIQYCSYAYSMHIRIERSTIRIAPPIEGCLGQFTTFKTLLSLGHTCVLKYPLF